MAGGTGGILLHGLQHLQDDLLRVHVDLGCAGEARHLDQRRQVVERKIEGACGPGQHLLDHTFDLLPHHLSDHIRRGGALPDQNLPDGAPRPLALLRLQRPLQGGVVEDARRQQHLAQPQRA